MGYVASQLDMPVGSICGYALDIFALQILPCALQGICYAVGITRIWDRKNALERTN